MNGYTIPPNAQWYLNTGYHVAPDGGFVYAGHFQIVYIPPLVEDRYSLIETIDIHDKIKALVCDNDWSETRLVAVISKLNSVLIYDLGTDKPTIGHKGHHLQKV